MKKIFSAILAVMILLSAVPASALTANESLPLLYYEINDDKVTITGAEFEAESLTIPESIEGHTVTAIADYAFNNRSFLKEIILPETITSIGLYAFAFSSITSINIPAGVTSIPEGAFSDCLYLKTVYYSGTSEQWDNITVGDLNDSFLNANVVFVTPDDSEKTESYTDFTLAATSEVKDGMLYVYYDLYNNPGIWSITVDMTFNDEALSLDEIINGEIFTDNEYVVSPVRENEHRYFAYLDAMGNCSNNGRLATFVFDIKDASLDYDITLAIDEENVFNVDGINQKLDVVNNISKDNGGNTPEIPAYTTGDIDGDGLINTQDVFRLKLFIKTIAEPTEAERLAADINGDGLINSADTFALSYRILRGEWA